jgi:hypothetical protein
MMDVCAGTRAERLTERWITADDILAGGKSVMLDFSCACPSRGGLEVGLFVDGEFSAGIASVEINGEPADPCPSS